MGVSFYEGERRRVRWAGGKNDTVKVEKWRSEKGDRNL